MEPSLHSDAGTGGCAPARGKFLEGLRELKAADLPLLLAAVAIPLLPTQFDGFAWRITGVLVLAVLSLLLLPMVRGGFAWRMRSPGNPLDRLFVLWLLFTGLGIPVAPNTGFAAYKFGYILSLAVFYYAFTTRIRTFSKALVFLGAFGLSAFSVSLIEIAFSNLPRQSVLYTHSYLAAQYLLPVLVMGLALAMNQGPRRLRAASTLAALPVLVFLFLTGSRGTYLALIAGIGLVLVLSVLRFSGKRGFGGVRKGLWMALPVLLAAIAVIGLLSVSGLLGAPGLKAFERVASLFDPELADFNFSRFQIWKDALSLSADHLLLGTGPGNFPFVFPGYQAVSREGVLHAHNQFIQVLAEGGGLGLFCFLAVVLELFLLTRQRALIDDGDDLRFALRAGTAGAFAVTGVICLLETPLEWPASAVFLLLPMAILLLPSQGEHPPTVESKPRWPWFAVVSIAVLLWIWPCMHIARAVRSGVSGEAGYRLYLEGRFEEACERLQASASIWPYRSEIYSALAIALVRSGKPEAACEAAHRALELRPGTVDMLTLRGRCLFILGRHKEAIGCLKEAIMRNPFNAEMNYFILGKSYRRTGAVEAALTVFRDLYENRFHQRNKGLIGFQALDEMARCLLALKREPATLVALSRAARIMTPGEAGNLESLRSLLDKVEAQFDLTPRLRNEVERVKNLVSQDLKKIEES